MLTASELPQIATNIIGDCAIIDVIDFSHNKAVLNRCRCSAITSSFADREQRRFFLYNLLCVVARLQAGAA
jgi:hypothetical protein